jgi:hypothetical protein
MTCSFLGSSRRNRALIGLAAAIAASACSASTGAGTSPLSNSKIARLTTYSWTYVNVNPFGGTSDKYQTEVTGINDSGEIIGFYSYQASRISTSHNAITVDTSFTSAAPYTTFNYASFPYSQATLASPCAQTCPSPLVIGTQMHGITSPVSTTGSPVLAGSVWEPGQEGGNWAVYNDQGVWLLQRPDGSADAYPCHYGYLFGINSIPASNGGPVAVGMHTKYSNSSSTVCSADTADLLFPPGNYMDVPFPWTVASSVAYGINDSGDIVGTACVGSSSKSCVQEGWYAICIKTSACQGGKQTSYCFKMFTVSANQVLTPYAISNRRNSGTMALVVGSTAGAGNLTQGFIDQITVSKNTTDGCSSAPLQLVTSPDPASRLTVVSGINDQLDIVGWYNEGSTANLPHLLGFVGTPIGASRPHHGSLKPHQ